MKPRTLMVLIALVIGVMLQPVLLGPGTVSNVMAGHIRPVLQGLGPTVTTIPAFTFIVVTHVNTCPGNGIECGPDKYTDDCYYYTNKMPV